MFFTIDIAVAASIPVTLLILRRKRLVSPIIWTFFWLGVAIGAVWEFGFHFTGPEYSDTPSYTQGARFPFHPFLQPICHSFWDAGIFLVGVFLVHKFRRSPWQGFNPSELSTFLTWGLSQALVIELVALFSSSGWSFTASFWNPAIISYDDKALTLAPLVIWGVAPIVYYMLALYLIRSSADQLRWCQRAVVGDK